MKRKIGIICAILSLTFLMNSAFALNLNANKPLNLKPLAAGASTAECDAYPTCITITNLSSTFIDIWVPALTFHSTLDPWYMQPIMSYDFDAKRVVLYDWTGDRFFDAYVPNHYELIVSDYMGKLQAKAK